jgi:hypothetical protein
MALHLLVVLHQLAAVAAEVMAMALDLMAAVEALAVVPALF